MATARFRLIFHVPTPAAAACKAAIFAAGAGRQGNYSECCFTTAGRGQFRSVEELCVETLCVGEETARKAVAALKRQDGIREEEEETWRERDVKEAEKDKPLTSLFSLSPSKRSSV
ncbi:hypothetical protein F5Y17DRAFT_442609 [Xylariaceae sp. FL0594]|nr:hypothetical protein F5Y17DRAFT_442609 [Xylariaceae sp. FL0594]